MIYRALAIGLGAMLALANGRNWPACRRDMALSITHQQYYPMAG
jgi:hypothetical protein